MASFESVLESFPAQLEKGVELSRRVELKSDDFDSVLVLGMGGSALGAVLARSYLEHKGVPLPVTVHKNYGLPPVRPNSRTLVLAFSYSGNTEETLSAFESAAHESSNLVAVTCGGKLAEMAKAKNAPVITLPTGIPPRFACGLFFSILLGLLASAGKAPSDFEEELLKCKAFCEAQKFKDLATQTVAGLKGAIPIIYSTDSYWPVAFAWKFNFNETCKVPSFWHSFPDVNHNETAGFGGKKLGDFHFFFLEDKGERERLSQRMRITAKIMREKGFNSKFVELAGEGHLQKLLYGVCLGNWVTYLKALELGEDATDPGLVTVLKKELETA